MSVCFEPRRAAAWFDLYISMTFLTFAYSIYISMTFLTFAYQMTFLTFAYSSCKYQPD